MVIPVARSAAVAAVVALVNPPMEAAIEASLPVLEGAFLTVANNFVVEEK